jgi:hypothetical protein
MNDELKQAEEMLTQAWKLMGEGTNKDSIQKARTLIRKAIGIIRKASRAARRRKRLLNLALSGVSKLVERMRK